MRDALFGSAGIAAPARKQQLLREAVEFGQARLEAELIKLRGGGQDRSESLELIAVIAFGRCVASLSIDIERLMALESVEPPAPFDAAASLRELFGFVPALFEAQTSCPALLAAEVSTLQSLLGRNGSTTRAQKEEVLFTQAIAKRNLSCAALHAEMLRNLGYQESRLQSTARAAHRQPLGSPARRALDSEQLALIAWAEFETVLQRGLDTAPDLECEFLEELLNPGAHRAHPCSEPAQPSPPDEDAALVERVRAGDMAAFGLLIKRHGRTVWRSVVALTGRPEDAEDHVQSAFIKAYERIADFRGESRFSTWLTRIAINQALQQLRRDRKLESLEPEDEPTWEIDGAKPRPANRWCQDPETNYSRAECQELVGRELAAIPAAYRLPVVLRDLQGLSGEETAAILGLPLATMKTRLLRGRAMLREALTPYFQLPKERPLA